MSISPVAGAGAVQNHAAVASTAKPESSEAPRAPDHDGDADHAAPPAPAAQVSSTPPGHVNVQA